MTFVWALWLLSKNVDKQWIADCVRLQAAAALGGLGRNKKSLEKEQKELRLGLFGTWLW